MFKPWITVPTSDIRVQFPHNIYDNDVRIMFKDVAAIDNVIEQLNDLRDLVNEMEGNG